MSGRIEKRVGSNPHLLFSGGYVELDTGFAFTSSFTVEARIKTSDITRNGQRIVIEDTGTNDGWALSLGDNNNPGTVRFYHRELAAEDLITDAVEAIVNDKEYHIAAVLDTGAGTKSVYVDGVLQAQDTGVPNTTTGSQQRVAIGRALNDTGRAMAGTIDDVRVWNVARTAAELLANKANGAIVGTETGLVGLWLFNTDTGVQLDQTAGDNDGTLVGAVAFADSPLEVSATKRVTAAVTASNAKRVTAAATIDHEKAVATSGATAGTLFSPWKDTWGDKEAQAGSGALTFGNAWGKTWLIIQGAIKARPHPGNEKGFAGGPTLNIEKRVTETPQS